MAHPIHPMIVHFPIAAWSLATLADIVSLSIGGVAGDFAGMALLIGVVTAFLAMLAGLPELEKIKKGSLAMSTAKWHILLITLAASLYVISLLLRIKEMTLQPPGILAAGFSLSGFIFLCIAGWMGAQLVYQYGVGVEKSDE